MRITRKKKRHYLPLLIGMLSLAVIGVVSVWAAQISHLFQPEQLNEMGEDVLTARDQVDAGMNFARQLREGEEESLGELFRQTSEQMEGILREQAALDAVAEEMIEEMHKTNEESQEEGEENN